MLDIDEKVLQKQSFLRLVTEEKVIEIRIWRRILLAFAALRIEEAYGKNLRAACGN